MENADRRRCGKESRMTREGERKRSKGEKSDQVGEEAMIKKSVKG